MSDIEDSEEDIKIEYELKKEKDEKKDEQKVEKEVIRYDPREVYLLFKRFKRLHSDAGRLLSQSQTSSKISMTIKMIIVIFGLTTSYVSAISGVEDETKTYITTIFGLGSAILSGFTSVKNFSKDSSKYYLGYQDYQEMASMIEPIFYRFEGETPYSELIHQIDKLIGKYEGVIKKNKELHKKHTTRRYRVFENLIYDKIKVDSGGHIPEWLEKQIEIEIHDNDIRQMIAKEEHPEEKKIPIIKKSFCERICEWF